MFWVNRKRRGVGGEGVRAAPKKWHIYTSSGIYSITLPPFGSIDPLASPKTTFHAGLFLRAPYSGKMMMIMITMKEIGGAEP